GMLICEPVPNSIPRKEETMPGISLPRPTPTAMQIATQTVRYLSKKIIRLSAINQPPEDNLSHVAGFRPLPADIRAEHLFRFPAPAKGRQPRYGCAAPRRKRGGTAH